MLIYNQVSRLSRTASLRSLSRSLRRQPTRSPSSHLPTLSCELFLTRSSTLLSSSLAMMSPAVLRQVGLAISSFMPSMRANSFCRVSLTLTRSPASRSSCDFMYSRMYFSPSRKVSSMMKSSRSRRFLNSSEITRYIRELKFSILMLMFAISLRTFTPRFYRHCCDSMRADQKLELQDTSPVQMSFCPPAATFSPPLGRASPPRGLSSKSSSELNLLSWRAGPWRRLLVWRGTKRGLELGSRGASCSCGGAKERDLQSCSCGGQERALQSCSCGGQERGLQSCSCGAKDLALQSICCSCGAQGRPWQSCSCGAKDLALQSAKQGSWDLVGVCLSLDRLLLLLLRVPGFVGEFVNSEFFFRKVSRLLSGLLIAIKQKIRFDEQELVIYPVQNPPSTARLPPSTANNGSKGPNRSRVAAEKEWQFMKNAQIRNQPGACGIIITTGECLRRRSSSAARRWSRSCGRSAGDSASRNPARRPCAASANWSRRRARTRSPSASSGRPWRTRSKNSMSASDSLLPYQRVGMAPVPFLRQFAVRTGSGRRGGGELQLQ